MNAFGFPGDVHRLARLAERQAPKVARARLEWCAGSSCCAPCTTA